MIVCVIVREKTQKVKRLRFLFIISQIATDKKSELNFIRFSPNSPPLDNQKH